MRSAKKFANTLFLYALYGVFLVIVAPVLPRSADAQIFSNNADLPPPVRDYNNDKVRMGADPFYDFDEEAYADAPYAGEDNRMQACIKGAVSQNLNAGDNLRAQTTLGTNPSAIVGVQPAQCMPHKTTDAFSPLQLSPWYLTCVMDGGGEECYQGFAYRGGRNPIYSRLSDLIHPSEQDQVGCAQELMIHNANGSTDPMNPSWTRRVIDNCTNQYILQHARYLRDPDDPSGDYFGVNTSICQPLRLMTPPTEHDRYEYVPSEYLGVAWSKLLVDHTYLYRDGKAPKEPNYEKDTRVEVVRQIPLPSDSFGLILVEDLAEQSAVDLHFEKILDPSHPYSPRWDFERTDRSYSALTAVYGGNPLEAVRCSNAAPVDLLHFRKHMFDRWVPQKISWNMACFLDKRPEGCYNLIWKALLNCTAEKPCCSTRFDVAGRWEERFGEDVARLVCGVPMREVCNYVARPLTPINTLKMRPATPANFPNGVPEGYAFSDYFSNHLPYMRCWDTNTECGTPGQVVAYDVQGAGGPLGALGGASGGGGATGSFNTGSPPSNNGGSVLGGNASAAPSGYAPSTFYPANNAANAASGAVANQSAPSGALGNVGSYVPPNVINAGQSGNVGQGGNVGNAVGGVLSRGVPTSPGGVISAGSNALSGAGVNNVNDLNRAATSLSRGNVSGLSRQAGNAIGRQVGQSGNGGQGGNVGNAVGGALSRGVPSSPGGVISAGSNALSGAGVNNVNDLNRAATSLSRGNVSGLSRQAGNAIGRQVGQSGNVGQGGNVGNAVGGALNRGVPSSPGGVISAGSNALSGAGVNNVNDLNRAATSLSRGNVSGLSRQAGNAIGRQVGQSGNVGQGGNVGNAVGGALNRGVPSSSGGVISGAGNVLSQQGLPGRTLNGLVTSTLNGNLATASTYGRQLLTRSGDAQEAQMEAIHEGDFVGAIDDYNVRHGIDDPSADASAQAAAQALQSVTPDLSSLPSLPGGLRAPPSAPRGSSGRGNYYFVYDPDSTVGSTYAIMGAGREGENCAIGGGMGVDGVANPDPISSWSELKLYYMRAMRQGTKCIVRHEKIFKALTGEDILLQATGVEWQKPEKDATIGQFSRYRTYRWPFAWRGYVAEPDRAKRFPHFGGRTGPIRVGLDEATRGEMLIFDKDVVMKPGDEGNWRNPYVAYVKDAVNERSRAAIVNPAIAATLDPELDYVRVSTFNHGRSIDACGNSDMLGMGPDYTLYKNRLPAPYPDVIADMDGATDTCADPLLSACIEPLWGEVKRIYMSEQLRD